MIVHSLCCLFVLVGSFSYSFVDRYSYLRYCFLVFIFFFLLLLLFQRYSHSFVILKIKRESQFIVSTSVGSHFLLFYIIFFLAFARFHTSICFVSFILRLSFIPSYVCGISPLWFFIVDCLFHIRACI